MNRAFLGLNDNNQLRLYVSSAALNEIGTRLEKGKPLPESVYAAHNNIDSPDQAIAALSDLAGYFKSVEKGEGRDAKSKVRRKSHGH